jgi:hypothetical protein
LGVTTNLYDAIGALLGLSESLKDSAITEPAFVGELKAHYLIAALYSSLIESSPLPTSSKLKPFEICLILFSRVAKVVSPPSSYFSS